MLHQSGGDGSGIDRDLLGFLLEASRRLRETPPAGVPVAVGEVLRLCGETHGLNRCLALPLAACPAPPPGSEWQRAGLARALPAAGARGGDGLGDWLPRLARGEIVQVQGQGATPGSFTDTQWALLDGTAALLVVPMLADGRLAGVAAFGAPVSRAAALPALAPVLWLLADLVLAAYSVFGAESAMRACEERIDVAVRGTGVGLWEWHVQTGRTTFDERWAEIIGYTLAELGPVNIETWVRFAHPDDLAASNEALQRHFRGEAPLYECEARMRHKNGDWIWVRDRGKVFERDADGAPLRMAGTHLDITDRKRAEAEHERLRNEFMQMQKMESVGRLAGGVAHDFNNLLMVISGYAEMLQLEEPGPASIAEYSGLILDAAHRGQELTQQLLAFSRKQVIRPRPLDLNHLIERSLRMYRRLIGEDIRLEFRPLAGLPTIKADPQQMDQLLANLLVNARDALHAAGRAGDHRLIHLDTRTLDIEPEDESFHQLARGPYVVLSVSDTGAGMDAETCAHIFDPFFTTKRRDQGTGLGLATVFGIVQQNGGTIRVYSEPGRGTTFRIVWPAAPGEEPAHDEPLPRRGALPGTETVVLAEDEAGVREFTVRALTRLGYRVLAAPDGDAAAAIIEGLPTPPALLLTDVVMPGRNGREVAELAAARFPALPVLYMSGHTDDIIARHGVIEAGVELIEKPFTVADLTQRLRALIDGPAGA